MEKIDAGRAFAYLGAGGGFGLSLWANVRDAYIPEIPDGVDPVLWREGYPGFREIAPTNFDLVLSGFFPVALFIALELLTRVKWNDSNAHKAIKWVGVGLPALVAGFISYSHLKTAMLLGGASEQLASVGPFAVDGFMLLCSVVLLMTGKHSKETMNTEPLNTASSVHLNTKPGVQMNTSVGVQALPMNVDLNTQMNAPVNTSEPSVQPSVQVDVPTVQSVDEHLNTEPVNTPMNTEMNTSAEATMNTDETVQVNTEPEAVNTPEPTVQAEPVNTPKKPATKKVNTPKAKPVNTDKAADLNTVREGLAAGKSVRAIAAEMNVSVGKVSGLKKEIEAGGPVAKAPKVEAKPVETDEAAKVLDGVDLDAELAQLLGNDDAKEA